MPDTFDWNQLRREQDGQTVVAPCVALSVWFDVTDAAVLLDFYERAMDALGPLVTHYLAESMKHFAKITPRARTMVPTWLKKPAELKFYHAEFRGAPDVHGASLLVSFRSKARLTPQRQEAYRRNLPLLVQQGLMASGVPSTTFRVTLPIDHPLAAPERLARWALDFEALEHGEFVTGGCDYSLNYDDNRGGPAARQAAWALCMLYPGLDYFDPAMQLWLRRYEENTQELLPLAKRAGWITLLAARTVDYLGGEQKLAAALGADPAVRVHRLASGLALQAGEAPRLGNRAQLDIPYRSVATAIRPARIERVGSPDNPDEWMTEWLDVLDRPLNGGPPP